MIWKIRPSDTFRNDYKILPRHIRILVPDILRSLAENPFEEFLSTHPLREKLQ